MAPSRPAKIIFSDRNVGARVAVPDTAVAVASISAVEVSTGKREGLWIGARVGTTAEAVGVGADKGAPPVASADRGVVVVVVIVIPSPSHAVASKATPVARAIK